MWIYFCLIIYWIFIYLISKLNNFSKKIENTLYSIGLILVMGLRGSTVGNDLNRYLYRYNFLTHNFNRDIFSEQEFGYQALVSIFKSFSLPDQGYIILISLVIVVLFSFFYYKYSKELFVSYYLHLTIGLFSMSMSGLRQTIAVGLVLVSFKYVIERKTLKFLIFVFLSYTFHNSALIFLVTYFIPLIKLNKTKGIVLWLLTASIILFRKSITPITEIFLPSRYETYDLISSAYPINPILILIALLIPLVCLFFWKEVEQHSGVSKSTLSTLFIMSLLNAIMNILSLNSNLLGRLSFYFVPFNMVLISIVVSSIKNKITRLTAYFACVLLPFIQFVLATPGGRMQIDNYLFFWQLGGF